MTVMGGAEGELLGCCRNLEKTVEGAGLRVRQHDQRDLNAEGVGDKERCRDLASHGLMLLELISTEQRTTQPLDLPEP